MRMSTPWRMRIPDVAGIVKKGNGMKTLMYDERFARCGIALLTEFAESQKSVAEG